jgi:hypothetical protein
VDGSAVDVGVTGVGVASGNPDSPGAVDTVGADGEAVSVGEVEVAGLVDLPSLGLRVPGETGAVVVLEDALACLDVSSCHLTVLVVQVNSPMPDRSV